MLEITSEMTQNKTHTHKRQMIHTVRLEEQNYANYLRFIIIKPPPGRIPDCMNKPFQYSAGAYMLSNSKRE